MLVRLLYKSHATRTLNWQEVEELLQVSASNNRERDITGCLLVWGDEYFQALEGEAQAVNDVYLKIAEDKRHADVQLMTYTQATSRLFADWQMKGFFFDNLPAETQELLVSKYASEQSGLKMPTHPEQALALILDLQHFQKAS